MALTKISGDLVKVGTGLSVGIITATTVQVGSATTIHTTGIDLGSGNITSHNINSTGIITSTSFVGPVTGNVTGDLTGDVTGNVTGDLTGDVTGNVTSSGANTLGSLTVTNDATVGGALTVTGDLTVNGTTTTIDTAVTAVDSLAIDGDASVGGSVGIGTDNPASTLDVRSNDTRFKLTSNGSGQTVGMTLKGGASDGFTYNFIESISDVDSQNWYIGGNGTANTFAVKTGGSEKLRITSGGNVGIGTDSPNLQSTSANNLVIADFEGEGGITIKTNINSSGNIFFADTAATANGRIAYGHGTLDAGDYMRFYVANDEKLRINANGNIGIGTDTPTERVHLDLGVFGSNNQDDFHGYLLSGDCTGNQGYIGYRTYLENSSADFGAYVRATRYAGSTFVGMEIGTDTNNRPIRFLTGGTTDTYERMRIQETGIVFIGDATPAASENGQLNVYTTTSGGLSQFVHSAGNGGLRLGGTGNGSAAHLVFSNDYNSGTWSDEYTIRMDGSDDSLRFLSGGVSGTERVRMRSDGNVVHLVSCISSGSGSDINSFYNNKEGCGMFTQGAYSSCGAHIEVGADATDGWANVYLNRYWTSGEDGRMIDFRISNTTVGTITSNTSGTTYNTTSDIRLKTDINPISDATDKLMNMNPVTHKWKEDPDGDTVHGFIAQEMQKISPESVYGEPDGEMMMGMDYGRITPIIVAALQNAIEEINTLKKRITELEN